MLESRASALFRFGKQVELPRLLESDFIETLLARIPPLPPNHQHITEFNEAGCLPENPVELEAGANRCAIP